MIYYNILIYWYLTTNFYKCRNSDILHLENNGKIQNVHKSHYVKFNFLSYRCFVVICICKQRHGNTHIGYFFCFPGNCVFSQNNCLKQDNMVPEIRIEDFDYSLPGERIAKYPLPERDSSKLLVYRDGNIGEHVFREIPEFLPKDSIMVFNDTKVVPARLHFQRETGAHIEIFCLEPIAPAEYSLIFSETEKCRWKCIVGNAKKWKSDVLTLSNPESDPDVAALGLKAKSVERNGETSIVEFLWNGGIPFSKVLETCGTIPIPPYLNRDSEAIDSQRYQTLYARFRGSVAAPTAGLHFTERVLNAIKEKGIDMETVCLHVGAGTFLPVKSETISGHTMHKEPFVVRKKFIEDIAGTDRPVIAVGTTSVRTLESLYFAGVQCIRKGAPEEISQWLPYETDYSLSRQEAFSALCQYMERNGLEELKLGTRIIIVPGYEFHVTDALVTNFHQPQSTLLLLISAFVDGDWKRIYDFALGHGFRFLSYGDSSLLFRRGNHTVRR